MVNNQLFRKIPPRDLALKILKSFGLNSFDDTRSFSRKDLEVLKCLEAINAIKEELQIYYLPCKSRTYLNDLDTKNVITILRQLVRLYGYSVISREKYIRGDKFMIYQVISSEIKNYQPIKIDQKQTGEMYVIDFN
tara:strand:+ start:84 stop:491 length:408 start_codon:yes stop_codon:yes gene_type:complete